MREALRHAKSGSHGDENNDLHDHPMINGIRLKVCGITSLVDAGLAAANGADYLGFIFHPRSPRFVSWESFHVLKSGLPAKPRVAVMVEPAVDDLKRARIEGFDYFQVHFPHDIALERVQAWSEEVGLAKLWLAPRVPPGESLAPAIFACTETILFDTYQTGTYGGTGKPGDWGAFSRLQAEHPRINWILAGGINAGNIAAALKVTHARWVDVNSGVESVPGIKSAEKLKQFCNVLREASAHSQTARPWH